MPDKRLNTDVDNTAKRYVIRTVATGPLNSVNVVVDAAIWRPAFYTYPYYETDRPTPARFTIAGTGGIKAGIDGYVVRSNCGSIAWSGANSKTAFAKEQFWSEVEPIKVRLSLRRGRTCTMRQQSYNNRHSVGAPAVYGAYGRDAQGRPFEPEQMTGRVSMYPQALTPSAAETPIDNEVLTAFEFRIYEFETEEGYEYTFTTVVDPGEDVALELWQDGDLKESEAAPNEPEKVKLTYQATKTGTAYLVARGGIIGSLPWKGTYGLKYSRMLKTVCTPSGGGPVGASRGRGRRCG